MNKRIKQLAEQAGSTHKQNLGVYQFYSDELEKFVELIVRECMDNLAWHGHDEAVSQLEWLKINRFGFKK